MKIFIGVFCLHLLLFFAFIPNLPEHKFIGHESHKIINAQVYFTEKLQFTKKNDRPVPKSQNTNLDKILTKNEMKNKLEQRLPRTNVATLSVNQKQLMQRKTAASHSLNALTAGQKNELLMLLHNAIIEKQVLPENALAEGQHGEVSLRFKLSPNGNIENLSVVKSSGFHSLDKAALQSVEKIAPFVLAKNFLVTEEYFEIPIDYKQ